MGRARGALCLHPSLLWQSNLWPPRYFPPRRSRVSSVTVSDIVRLCTRPICRRTSRIPCLAFLSVLDKFSSFSGYEVNLNKSERFPIDAAGSLVRRADLPFKIGPSGSKRLGVYATRAFSGFFSANFTPLVARVKSDLRRWNNSPLSLVGKISVVKINVLPKLLYLFRSIPLFLPKHFFDSLDEVIGSFVRGARSPRVRRSSLRKREFSWGLALPNFLFYRRATRIHKIRRRIDFPNLIWCEPSARFCSDSSSVSALIYSSLPVKISTHT